MTVPLVSLADVVVRFGQRIVLNGVNLHVEPGVAVGLIGPSGAGKSTLLGVIAGLIRLDAGVRSVSTDLADRNAMAWVVQSTPILNHRTAVANVTLGALAAGQQRTSAEVAARAVMADLGISDLAEDRGFQLSGGERQRVSLARGLAAGARLVLTDEPTAALDHDNRALVIDALRRAAASGCSVVMATHDPAVAAACNEVHHLRDGMLSDPDPGL